VPPPISIVAMVIKVIWSVKCLDYWQGNGNEGLEITC
jgi:hypothetical protein